VAPTLMSVLPYKIPNQANITWGLSLKQRGNLQHGLRLSLTRSVKACTAPCCTWIPRWAQVKRLMELQMLSILLAPDASNLALRSGGRIQTQGTTQLPMCFTMIFLFCSNGELRGVVANLESWRTVFDPIVSVLDRQTYPGGTRGSRLCGEDRDRETENSKVCTRTRDTRFMQVRATKVASPTSCLGDQVWRPALGVG
jgi:hypothetical protein